MAVATLLAGMNDVMPWHYIVMNNILFMTNGWDIPRAWDGVDTGLRRWGIDPPANAPTCTNYAVGNLDAGTYYWRNTYAFYDRGAIIRESNPSDISTALVLGANRAASVNGTNVPSEMWDSGEINRVYAWRTKKDTITPFYRVGYTSNQNGNYKDNTADANLPSEILTWETERGVPPRFLYPIAFLGRAFLAGQRRYSTGTLYSGNWPAFKNLIYQVPAHTWENIIAGTRDGGNTIGWDVFIDGETQLYRITAYGTPYCTVHTDLAAEASAATYAMSGRKQNWIAWSQPALPDYWKPTDQERVGQEEDDVIEGVYSGPTALAITRTNSIYELIAQTRPTDGALILAVDSRGCTNQNCIVQVDNQAYILDQFGMHIYTGGRATTPISTQISQLIQESDQATRVNWDAYSTFHGFHDIAHRKIVWFVAMGTDTVPHDALCYYYDRKLWAWENYEQGIMASCTGLDSNGIYRVWLADDVAAGSYRYCYGIGHTDGADADTYTVRGTITSINVNLLYDSAATLPDFTVDNAYAGLYFWLEHASTGTVERRRIISTGSGAGRFTLASAFDSAAAVGDEYWVAAVESQCKFGIIDAEAHERLKYWNSITLVFVPQATDFDVALRLYLDQSSTAYSGWADTYDRDSVQMTAGSADVLLSMSKEDGTFRIGFGGWYRYVQPELYSLDSDRDFTLKEIQLTGTAQGHPTG